jgi:PLP dependent protein
MNASFRAAEQIRERIHHAAAQAQRLPATVTLIAVIKGQSSERIQAGLAPWIRDIGENYLNEALVHQAQLGRDRYTWHFIGRIQTNKTRGIAQHFDWVHCVDRLKLIERLEAQRGFHGPKLQVCLQANLWDEPHKGGALATELLPLAQAVLACQRLELRGLMALPPETADPLTQRQQFERLAEAAASLQQAGIALDTLSMGMSGDFEPAILAGATHIRIGSSLFGARTSPA